MTVEEYRQRMIQAFHNADCDQFIALVCLPTEKEFEHLEWLLNKEFGTEKNCETCEQFKEKLINHFIGKTPNNDDSRWTLEGIISEIKTCDKQKTWRTR